MIFVMKHKNNRGSKAVKKIKSQNRNPEIMEVLRRCKGGAHKSSKGNRNSINKIAIEESFND